MSNTLTNLLYQISRTNRAMFSSFEQCVGQPLPKWRILYVLQQQSPLTQKQLAEALPMDPAAVTRLLKSMEQDQLVKRVTDQQDNRQTLVALTENGIATIERILPQRQFFLDQILADISMDEVEIVFQFLQRLEGCFRQQSERFAQRLLRE